MNVALVKASGLLLALTSIASLLSFADAGNLRKARELDSSDSHSSDSECGEFQGVGPYSVGFQQTLAPINYSRQGTFSGPALPLDVWFPADPSSCSGEASYNVLGLVFGDVFEDEGLPLPGVQNCNAVATGEKFPLISYSHGTNGSPYESLYILAVLASYGFIVAVPAHIGNTAFDQPQDSDAQINFNRPRDIIAVNDFLLGSSAFFSSSIDPNKVGVFGYSRGGNTAYASAVADDRIKALATMAGSADPAYGAVDFNVITEPILLLSGTKDARVPIENNTELVWGSIETDEEDAYRVDIFESAIGASHTSFGDICTLYSFALQLIRSPNVPISLKIFLSQGLLLQLGAEAKIAACPGIPGIPTDVLPIEEVHGIVSLYAVSFFKTHLDGDDSFEDFLDDEFAKDCNLNVTSFELGDRHSSGSHE